MPQKLSWQGCDKILGISRLHWLVEEVSGFAFDRELCERGVEAMLDRGDLVRRGAWYSLPAPPRPWSESWPILPPLRPSALAAPGGGSALAN